MSSKHFFPTSRDLPDTPLRRLCDGVLNLVFPDSCFVCAAPVARKRECSVCAACWKKVLRLQISPPWCPCCGLPFGQPETTPSHLCGSCSVDTPPFCGARSFGYYTGELSRLIQGLKFEGRRNLTSLLSPLLAATFLDSWNRDEIEAVMPVPLHPKRRRERGYNQAGLLGARLAEMLAVPFYENFLRRIRHTSPQVGLTDSERRRNLKGAFACARPEKVSRRSILVIDDVMTTGATIASACEALLEAGALRVSVLTVARTVIGLE